MTWALVLKLAKMYDLAMTESLPVSQAKAQLGALIERAQITRVPIYLTRHGRSAVVLIDAGEFERLHTLAEDADDARAAITARKEIDETGALPVPWEQVKAELGLT